MKIRAGFVSNSSSTSFLIIAREELNEATFLDLMGVSPKSPIVGIFRQLFDDVLTKTRVHVNFQAKDERLPVETWFNDERLSERMLSKLRDAKAQGLIAYYGFLTSDENQVQSFFCTDSFELENDGLYFNALECVW